MGIAIGVILGLTGLVGPTAKGLENLNYKMEERALDRYEQQLAAEYDANKLTMKKAFDYTGYSQVSKPRPTIGDFK